MGIICPNGWIRVGPLSTLLTHGFIIHMLHEIHEKMLKGDLDCSIDLRIQFENEIFWILVRC